MKHKHAEVKHEKKPDSVYLVTAVEDTKMYRCVFVLGRQTHNLKLTFDGETQKLIGAEVLK